MNKNNKRVKHPSIGLIGVNSTLVWILKLSFFACLDPKALLLQILPDAGSGDSGHDALSHQRSARPLPAARAL